MSGVVIGKKQCPQCADNGNDNSKDNLVVYDDHSTYCFACEYTEQPNKNNYHKQHKVNKEKPLENTKEPISAEKASSIRQSTTFSLEYRGIRAETHKYFGVRYELDDDKQPIKQYCPTTVKGKLSGYKPRTLPKTFGGSIGQTGAECDMFGQFRFKSSKSRDVLIVGGECFDGQTEVLTEEGFVKFEELSRDVKVAQYLQDSKSIEYVNPVDYVEKFYSGKMMKVQSKYVDLFCTEGHNLFFRKKDGTPLKKQAKEKTQVDLFMETSVIHDGIGIDLTDDQISLTLAICADFKIDVRKSGKKMCHAGFIKNRKIERIKGLLERLEIDYTSFQNSYGDGKNYTTFNLQLPDWCDGKVIPKDWITKASLSQKKHIIDEMALWDGNFCKGRDAVEFSSKYYSEANTVYQIAVTSGYHCSISARSNKFGDWFRVRISFNKKSISTQQFEKSKVFSDFEGMVYCVTVPSGNIVVRRNGKTLVIGNCDVLSAYQMLRDYQIGRGHGEYDPVAVVSPTIGETGAGKQAQGHFKFFDRFERIIVGLDNDDAGKEATEKLIKCLPKGKVYLVEWSKKDPNEYLMDNETKRFISDFYAAKKYVPAGVVGSGDLYQRLIEKVCVPKIDLPPFMKKLDNMIGSIELGSIGLLAAGTGAAKTTVANELIYYWLFNSPYKVGVVTLELDAGSYAQAMLSRHLEVKISNIPSIEEKMDFLSDDVIKEKAEELFKINKQEDRWMLIDERDGSLEQIKEKIEELIISCGCRIIILDPVSDLLDGVSIDDQAVFMKWMKSMTKNYNVTFLLIAHIRKSGSNQQAASAGGFIPEESVIGSSTLIKSASFVVMMMRDKYNTDEIVRNTTTMMLSKNRSNGITGESGKLYYCNKTHRLYDIDDFFPQGIEQEIDF